MNGWCQGLQRRILRLKSMMGRDSIGTEPDGSEEESAGGFGVPGTGLKRALS